MNVVSIVPNQNSHLYVATLAGDELEFTPIVAWAMVKVEYAPEGQFMSYADPIPVIPVDNRAVIDRTTMEWWYGIEISGVGKESLIERLKAVA